MLQPSKIINALESDDKILSFTTQDGLPLWFIVRYEVYLAVLNSNNELNTANTSVKSKSQLIKSILLSCIKSPFLIKRHKIIFFNSGVTNVRQPHDQNFFNRVTDNFFFKVKSQALLIEDEAPGELRRPRVHNQVYSHLNLILFTKLFSFLKKHPLDLEKVIDELVTYVCERLGSNNIEVDYNQILKIVQSNSYNFYSKNNFYRIFLKWKQPKVIFLEDASYGGHSFILLNAKKLNIPVVELQHGFVNEEHFAYRLGSGILNNKFSKLFYPDYFLAYGRFWEESINIPSKIVTIGNPYLSTQLQKLIKKDANSTILFLSSGVTINETIDFLLKLNQVATPRGYSIVFRPHPLEVDSITNRYKVLMDAGIKFSVGTQLYDDFSSSDIIIGELTTALFEAIAIKDKKKFLFMSSYTKSYFNDRIKIPQLTEQNINDIFKNDYPESISHYFWSDDWEKRFDNFIKEI